MLDSILIKSDIKRIKGIEYKEKINDRVNLAVKASTLSLLKCLLAVR